MINNGRLINPEVRIENTSKCNANCAMCPHHKMTRPQVTMHWGFFVDIIDQIWELQATDVALFGFGEPLLDRDIAPRISYCTKKGLTTHLTTNASLLDIDKAHDLLDAGLGHIRFSLHATSPKLYNAVHRGLDWFTVTKNIFNFLEINRVRGKPCTTHISAMPLLGEPLNEVRDTWEKAVDYLEVWRPHNWVYGKSYRKIGGRRKKTCGRPFHGPLQINADGKMMICCFDYDAKMTIGDLHEQTIIEILADAAFQGVQNAHELGDLGTLICDGCDQLNIDGQNPLYYSNRDPSRAIGVTSTGKYKVEK